MATGRQNIKNRKILKTMLEIPSERRIMAAATWERAMKTMLPINMAIMVMPEILR